LAFDCSWQGGHLFNQWLALTGCLEKVFNAEDMEKFLLFLYGIPVISAFKTPDT
jgi:hypothetical protein